MDNSLIEKVKVTISKYSMVEDGDKILCGYSGGADSTALLLSLIEIYPKENIIACHINHMIRGDEALRDENHCINTCNRLGIKLFVERINIPQLVKENGGSTEEVARDARYSFFAKLCENEGINKIAVAHNKKDNAETVIFNLARGSSLPGLSGIPAIRDNIIRPLINVSREEIEDYLSIKGETYVTDSTNSDSTYTRNLIRNEILPLLEKISPCVVDNISRMSDNLRRDEECLKDLSQSKKLCDKYDSLLSRDIIEKYGKLSNGNLTSQNINDCIDLIHKNVLWSEISLPNKIKCRITRNGYEFVENISDENIFFDIPLSIGENETPYGTVMFTKNSDNEIIINTLSIMKKFSSDTISGMLRVRSRNAGDKILVNGHHKSLKKYLNEKKIDQDKRDKLIIFYDDNGILWIPNVGCRDLK